MISLSAQYIPDKDMWYFPHKQIYLKRWLFLWADTKYLNHVLDCELDDRALRILSQEPRIAQINVTDYTD